MAGTIDRTPQILALVLDSLQVVSYKWLSRKFSISSNESKRLLQIVADQHGNDLDIIYAVSGWSKADRNCYSVKLVPKSKVQEAKNMLDGHVSIHIYSIQPCQPKDPAELWSAEYVQSEELFRQPAELNNCLRDNRFSAVSCSSVTRKVIETGSAVNTRPAAAKVTAKSAKSSSADKVAVPTTSAAKIAAPSTIPPQPSTVQADVLAESAHTSGVSRQDAPGNNVIDMGTVSKAPGTLAGPGNKGGATSKKKITGSGEGSLANLWGRAGTKLKPVQTEIPVGVTANTEPVHDSCLDASSDDEDAPNFARLRRGDMKNTSKRTRRMVLDDDLSDENTAELEDENIVSLSSPEAPKEKLENSSLLDKNGKGLGAFTSHLNKVEEDTLHVNKGKETKQEKKDLEDALHVIKGKETKQEKKDLEVDNQTSKPAQAVTNGVSTPTPEPKKRKVLKTKMDERGREVTEVVWETLSPVAKDGKKEDSCVNISDAANGPVQIESTEVPSMKPNVKASSAVGKNSANKATGGKSSGKVTSKDAQQGRISSFFKKKN